MKFLPALFFLILLALYCAFIAPALIAKNTPESFDMLISMFVILLVSTIAAILVAINKDRSQP